MANLNETQSPIPTRRRLASTYERYEWLLVLLLSPLLLFPSMHRAWVVLVLPAAWLVAGIVRRRLLPGTPLDWPWALVVVMVAVSAWATYDLSLSLGKIAGVVLGLAVFRALTASRRPPVGLTLVVVMLGAAVAGLGLLTMQSVVKVPVLAPLLSRLPRALTAVPGTDSGINPNEVAGALLWTLPVAAAVVVVTLREGRRLRQRLGLPAALAMQGASLLATLLMAVTLLLTQSRSAYLAVAATAVAAAFVPLRRRARVALASALALGGLALMLLILTGRGDALLGEGASSPETTSLTSVEQRVEVWSRAFYGIQDFPFTGMGMNTFRRIVHVLYPLFLIGPEVDIAHAHNEFLQAALDLGIPGLIAFLSLYMGAYWMLWRTWQSDGMRSETIVGLGSIVASRASTRALTLGTAAGLFAHMLYGMTDAIALGAKPGIILWLLLALATRLYLASRIPAPMPQTEPQPAAREAAAGD